VGDDPEIDGVVAGDQDVYGQVFGSARFEVISDHQAG
jgi:hypothetical protein